MWNHNMRYQSPSYLTNYRNVMIDAAGGINMQGEFEIWSEYPTFYPENDGVLSPTDPYWMVRADWIGPARKAGEKLVLILGVYLPCMIYLIVCSQSIACNQALAVCGYD